MKRYRVYGYFENLRIDEVVNANSKKQAKVRAGFSKGIYGQHLRRFMRSGGVRVSRY